MLQKCVCGSQSFKASITLSLVGVPVTMHDDGTMSYDDTNADYSEGWDTDNQPEIQCAACSLLYDLQRTEEETADGQQTFELDSLDVDASKLAPGRDEEEG